MAEQLGVGSFRWRAGVVLAGLGAFLLATGIMLRAYVYDHVAVIPLNTYAVTTLRATGATYFDQARLTTPKGLDVRAATRTGLDVSAVTTIRSDARAARGNIAVFDTFLAVQASDGTAIEFVQSRLALDRHTGGLVNCCGTNINGNHQVRQAGLSFKFPFFAQKVSYSTFDADVGRVIPSVYRGQETIDGMRVYRYDQVLPPTQIYTRQVPPQIMGMRSPVAAVTIHDFEATTMSFWIDPVLGVPVKVEQNTRQVFKTPDGTHSLVVFAADLRESPADVAASVHKYHGQSVQLYLAHNVLPPVDLISGPALLVIGVILAYTGHRRRTAAYTPQRDVAAVEARMR